ncbi:MAG TPA: hypothetical protein VJV05_15360, partial [Pyrinomonadaceae bacterium]|nr:hypothetical protein [Pyrinomonadaceae bacterium]
MPTKKKTPKTDINIRAAMAIGKTAGAKAVALRQKQQRKRAALEDALPKRRRAPGPPRRLPSITRAFFGKRESIGVLLAEGDSWFDYPGKDILALLEDEHLYDVKSVAHMGDCVEDMAHSDGQLIEFTRRLEKLLGEGKIPRAILLSGGGNDIAGDEFSILLNHAASSLPPFNENIVSGVIDIRLKEAYVTILSSLTEVSKKYLGKPLPIVIHGYDHPFPDGRGFMGGWWKLPGPWLKPGFERKGYSNLATNTELVAELIDRFNAMLATVTAIPAFAHVHYLDLRGTLKPNKKDWANELHPSPSG